MDYKETHKILDKYFAGNSSLREEKLLKEYFLKNKNIPNDLQYANYIFKHFEKESSIHYSGTKKTISKKSVILIKVSSIAAGILILISLLILSIPTKEKVVYAYINGNPITNKLLAIKETHKAISIIKNKLNQGTKDLYILSKFNESEQLITKNK